MIKLGNEETKILAGDENDIKKKMLKAIILFADFYDAKEFVSIDGPGHIALGFGNRGFEVVQKILEELLQNSLTTKHGFTISSWLYSYLNSKNKVLGLFYKKSTIRKKEEFLEEKLSPLGLDTKNKYLDAISLAKSKLIKYGDVVCWSDSFLSTFAGSVLGAKVVCTGPLIDLFCNIFGKVPALKLLSKEGRKAKIIIKIEADTLPDAGLLGVSVAQKSEDKIPYIFGLEKLLKAKYDDKTLSFLKDFSAGFSSVCATNLFHINGITPEARKLKKQLLCEDCPSITINLHEIEKVKENFDLAWKNLEAKPNLCVLGEPALSLYQLVYWTNEIGWELKQNKRKKLKVKTIFVLNKEVLKQFKPLPEFKELKKFGGKLKTFSPFNVLLSKNKIRKKIITNSNKIRNKSNFKVKFCKDDEILAIITGKKGTKHDWV